MGSPPYIVTKWHKPSENVQLWTKHLAATWQDNDTILVSELQFPNPLLNPQVKRKISRQLKFQALLVQQILFQLAADFPLFLNEKNSFCFVLSIPSDFNREQPHQSWGYRVWPLVASFVYLFRFGSCFEHQTEIMWEKKKLGLSGVKLDFCFCFGKSMLTWAIAAGKTH